MKFVHIADMHFDTPFTLLSSRRELGEARRMEQRQAFKKAINYIKENNIPYLFIAGDLYEQEYVKQSTIEYINNLFKEIPETKIYISPGNHDPNISNSYYNKYKWSENVKKIFTSKIEKIEEPEFTLYGFGFDDFYCYKSGIEEIQIEDKTKTNILLTHASLDGGYDDQREYNTLSSKKLKELGFDYIALGHIHKIKLTDNIIFPGSMVSMGFDELGKHGMLVGEIEQKQVKIEFIELDEREFKEEEIDITEIETIEELLQKIVELKLEEKNYYKIILTGKRNFEINTYKIYKQIEIKNIIKIKDKTKLNYNLEEISKEISLKGIFAKEMLKKLQNENINKETIEKAIEIGMEVLS